MSEKKIISSRNMYINTEYTPYGNGESFRLSLPPAPFSCKANQRMTLTLLNLEIRKNWYEINKTNNTFFIQLHNLTATPEIFYPVIIPPGSYRAFGVSAAGANASVGASYNYTNNDLCSALKYAIDKTLNIMHTGGLIRDSNNLAVSGTNYPALNVFGANAVQSTVAFNAVTRKFTITLPVIALAGYTIDIIFAQLKTDFNRVANFGSNPFNNSNVNLYNNWSFQDSHEILGGIPTRDNNLSTIAPFFRPGMVKNGNVFTSPYVGQLNSLEGLYLRMFSSNTNNYASPAMDRDSENLTTMTPTNILARIPLTMSVYDDNSEMITYMDTGISLYKIILDTTQLNNIQMSLTDDKNRPITEVSSGAADNGILSFKMTLRWDLEQLEFSISSAPASLTIEQTRSPVGFVSPLAGMGGSNHINTIHYKPKLSHFDPVSGNRNTSY